jgi:predicted nucleic acid-binding protein
LKYLLDVNVLLAAVWPTHNHHADTFAWLADKQIAVCPICELGFLRISTNKKALGADMVTARRLLAKFCSDLQGERIHDDLPALDSHPGTSDQVTDHYLADLAAKHGLKLATLDEHLKHPSAELVR